MAAEWFYAKDGRQLGPITWEQLYELAITGSVLPTDLVWRQGMPQWSQARTIPGLIAPAMASAGAPAVVASPMQYTSAPAAGAYSPLSYATPMPVRPGTPKVVGILGIVYASLGLLVGLFALINAASSEVRQMGVQPWNFFSAAISLSLAVLLLSGSIALTKYRRSGQFIVTLWASVYILWDIIVVIVMLTYIMPRQIAFIQAAAGPNGPAMMRGPLQGVMMGGIVMVALICLVYPTVALILLTRPSLQNWFKQSAQA